MIAGARAEGDKDVDAPPLAHSAVQSALENTMTDHTLPMQQLDAHQAEACLMAMSCQDGPHLGRHWDRGMCSSPQDDGCPYASCDSLAASAWQLEPHSFCEQ